ncbi:MAG: hypothetical protein BGO98_27735 [Myxococcales bacterium 68-20]|nr:MAG: hypothetical protein BGO98_27735 [Myxococcales bacterium 68-20]
MTRSRGFESAARTTVQARMPISGLLGNKSLRIAALAAPLVGLLVACGSSSMEKAEGIPTPPDGAAPPAFSPALCQGALCWLAPLPQGNFLRAVATSETGTSFAVGDHAVVLRSSGTGWTALALPPRGQAQRNLRAVHVLADDDVWIAGERGVVHHFDGTSFTENAPAAATDDFISVWAASSSDVWAVAAQGRVWRYDGAAWSESLSAKIGGVSASLVGMWASAADDVWVLGGTEEKTRLWHFDGAAWTDESLAPSKHDEVAVPGAPVAISGAARGEPFIAFEHRVVARSANGTLRDVYFVSIKDWQSTPPNTALFVRGPSDVLLARTAGNVQHFVDTSKAVSVGDDYTQVPGFAFGTGPGGRPFVLRAGGRLSDPVAASGESRAIETGELTCAPSGEGTVCLERLSDGGARLIHRAKDGAANGASEPIALAAGEPPQLRTDAKGSVALFTPASLVVRDAGGTRTMVLPSPGDLQHELRDVALTEDGRIYALTAPCDLHVAKPGATTFARVDLKDAAQYEEHCHLHRPSPSTVFVTTLHYLDEDVPEDRVMTLRSADGALVRRATVPRLSLLDPMTTVTASGKLFIAGQRYGATAADADWHVWRLDGKTWTPLDGEWANGSPMLAAYGETLVVHVAGPFERESGSELHVIDDAGTRQIRLPTHGLSTFAMIDDRRILGTCSVAEAIAPAFAVPVASVFVADL